jgi:hypothetical protein
MWEGPRSLFGLISMTYGLVATVVLYISFFKPQILANKFLFYFVIPFCIVVPFGGWWAIYQSLRYEKRPWRYVAIVFFIPAGFIWYYFERYRVSKRYFRRGQKRSEDSANL